MEENETSENEIELQISIVPKDNMFYIYEECGSGCKYPYENLDKLGNIFQEYVDNYVKVRVNENTEEGEIEND